jgi:hypothetical protein
MKLLNWHSPDIEANIVSRICLVKVGVMHLDAFAVCSDVAWL